MTTTTDAPPLAFEPRPHPAVRVVLAFVLGVVAALALVAGGLWAFDQAYAGKVLPGVRVGTVDVSGLDETAARDALTRAYASLADGELVLSTPDGSRSLTFAQVGRAADVDAMAAEAVAFGRSGSAFDRFVGNAKTAVRGVSLEPQVRFDEAAVARRIEAAAAALHRDPVDARVVVTESGFRIEPGTDGRVADPAPAIAAALDALGRLDAPDRVEIEIPVRAVEPNVTTREAIGAKEIAQLLARDVRLTFGKSSWDIAGDTIRGWMSFAAAPDGTYQPIVDTSGLPKALKPIAKKIAKAPRNASFLLDRNDAIVGVTASANGRAMDVAATAALISEELRRRAAGTVSPSLEPVTVVKAPALTTAEAEKAAPLMERISTWKTYFPVNEKNGFGANIWIPAGLIDGYVVGPGETFDFWKAVGPVTREKGYKDGGAIINGKTEPQGALAGGICSCSTTLFNAALRAGFEMGDRRNHYYYIDRYPLGLDATVFISASGHTQTMSWRNDTDHPVLIRGINTRDGNDGWVRFDLYSVPTGRKVSFSKPVVKDVRRATDTIQYTTTLAPGVQKRIEYPVDGMKVWVTRTVRDRSGAIIHQDTYYSNYARITGIVLVGRAPTEPAEADDDAAGSASP